MNRTGRAISLQALLPAVALASPALPQAAADAFVPPERPMVLTRALRRPLPDGKEVVTLRSYLVHFERDGDRIRVDGELLGVTVDAPPVLHALAELERNRPDVALFPMWLDRDGLLLASAGPSTGPAQQAAVAQAATTIDRLALPPRDSAEARAFVDQFRGRPGAVEWPQDLFRPAPGRRHETRTVAMTGGQRGEATIETQATAAGSGLLRTFQRRTTTQIEGNSRVAIEEWTLVDPHQIPR